MRGLLSRAELEQTGAWIASLQLSSGMVPWYAGGHADPWNHTEAAMALVAAGRRSEAEAAYEWLRSAQHPDGSWCLYYLADGVEEPRRDPNVCAYVATGVWWHYLETGDDAFLRRMWPVVDRAIEFVVGLQAPRGEILWNRDVDGRPGTFALLTANASIHHSIRCALAIANHLGESRFEWEIVVVRLGDVLSKSPETFVDKDRWAMDWYYPILSGALSAEEADLRLRSRSSRFLLPGVGVRCVSSNPWVTAAETAECVMAFDAVGRSEEAIRLLEWTRHLRDDDGSYWTGCVHPECVRFPGGEHSTYGAAAVVMAHHVVLEKGPGSGLFRRKDLRPGECVRDLLPVTDA